MKQREFLATFFLTDGRDRYFNFYASDIGDIISKIQGFHLMDISYEDKKIVKEVIVITDGDVILHLTNDIFKESV